MPRYLLLQRVDATTWDALSPEDRDPILQRFMSWSGELRAEGRTVTVEVVDATTSREIASTDPDGPVTVGPYDGTVDAVDGFWVVSAADHDDAVRVARRCPALLFGGRVEVVRLIDPEDLP